MAAAAYAAISANADQPMMNSIEAQRSGAPPRKPCTMKLPPGSQWVKSGVLYKHVPGHSDCQWQPRRVVITQDHMCITRMDSDDVLERLELLHFQHISVYHPDSDFASLQKRERRGSATSVELILKKSASVVEQEKHGNDAKSKDSDRPALQFKVVDSQDNKRRYCFGATTKLELNEWLDALKKGVRLAEDRVKGKNKWKYVQTLVALAIIGNFAMAICKAQLVPEDGSSTATLLEDWELFFTALFTTELTVNMIANWLLPFWKDWWNIFDFVIVSVSILAIPMSDVQGFSLLRMMRVFRVVRLFNSLKALKTIITALTSAIIPVANAFAVLAVATAIYAVIGVGLYEARDPEHFGDFKRAIFTMFQVITGDSWATAIARPMFGDDRSPSPSVALFFASYILIVGTFLLNVVVAVLLDEFITSVQIGKAEQRKKSLNKKKTEACLDPLLVSFGVCENSKSLSSMIEAVYRVLDADDSGGLSFEEFRDGLQRLETEPTIYLSPENFDEITEGRALCDGKDELDLFGFETVIRHQLKLYAQRKATFEMQEADQSNNALAALLLMSKQTIFELEALKLRGEQGGWSRVNSAGAAADAWAGDKFRRLSSAGGMQQFGRTGSADTGDSGMQGRARGGGNADGGGSREESAMMQKMDKKLSRLYSKLSAMHDVMGGRQRGGRGRGKSRQREEDGWDSARDLGGEWQGGDDEWFGAGDDDGVPWDERQDRSNGDRSQSRRQRRRSLEVRRDGAEGGPQDRRGEGGRGAQSGGGGAERREWGGSMLEAVLGRLEGMEQRLEELGREQRGLSARVAQSSVRLERKVEGLARGEALGRVRSSEAEDGGQLAGIAHSDGSWREEVRAVNEMEGFIGATATQLMLGGMARNTPRAARSQSNGGLSKLLSAKKGRRQQGAKDESPVVVTGELTFEPKGGGRRADGVGRPPAGGKGSSDAVAVRVSWLCSPALAKTVAVEPPPEPACDGCHKCRELDLEDNGFIGVGCVLGGERLVMVANTDDMLGSEHQVAGPDVLAVMAQGLLRRHGHHDKTVNPSKFVDTPHGDGRHWFRCYLLLGLLRSSNSPSLGDARYSGPPSPQTELHPAPQNPRRSSNAGHVPGRRTRS